MFQPKLNPIEPPWYGPVCPVVWEGRRREASPYPDQRPPSALDPSVILNVSPLANGDQRRNDMGHSQYDFAGRGRPAWNAGKRVASNDL